MKIDKYAHYLAILIMAFFFSVPAQAATYTVSNTNDSGAGSLRQAIIDSNAAGGSNTINFTAPTGTITLLTDLNTITNTATFTSTASSTITLTGKNMGSNNVFSLSSNCMMTVGSGSGVSVSNEIHVGRSGTAVLNIDNGGTVSDTVGYIANPVGTTGTVNVDGAGSTWTNSSFVSVGLNGTAYLNVTNGGTVNSTIGYVGFDSQSTGTATVDGASSTWTCSSALYIGNNGILAYGNYGNGTLNVKNGGTVNVAGGAAPMYMYSDTTHQATINIGGGAGTTNGTINALGITGLTATMGIVNFNHDNALPYTFATPLGGTLRIDQKGPGTTVLTGANTYTGTTTVTAGTLQIGGGGTTGTLGAGAVTNNSALRFNRTDAITVLNAISGTGTLEQAGSGTLTLTGNNIFSGLTTVSAGTLSLGRVGGTITGDVTVSGGTLDVAQSDTVGAVTLSDGAISGAGTLTGTSYSLTDAGTISANISGAGALTKTGLGTATISNANTAYTGATTISAGTLAVTDASALGTGAVTNNAILDLGATDLNLGSTYNQAGKLKLSVNSATDYGNIISTGVSAITGSTIDVTVNGYLANNATLDIVTGSGVTYNTTTVNALGNPHYSFTASNSGTILTLTVNRTSGGFASAALNPNQVNIGNVLDNITNPTSDMTTVLNALDALSNSAVAQALNTMLPDISAAILQVSQSTLDQLTQAILGHQSYLRSSHTGVSTGSDMLKGVDVWAQGYGSYLHQDPRELSQGYNASIWGTALGLDLPALNDLRIGTCFGFAQDYIRGKDNSNRSDVNAYQWTVYGEYSKDALYIDLSGAFAFNTYDGSRQVNAGPGINRTASSDYNGEQYQIYAESGYTLGYKKLNITPLASFQYQHLHLDKYTETGAGALNLTVKSQDYDLAQTGLGVKLDYPLDTKYGNLVPEIRVKWLYDWVGDAQSSTSSFTGGGASFATNGFTPAQSSWDFGTKLTMFTKNNWTLAANYDFELKEDYYGHYGYANAKYSF